MSSLRTHTLGGARPLGRWAQAGQWQREARWDQIHSQSRAGQQLEEIRGECCSRQATSPTERAGQEIVTTQVNYLNLDKRNARSLVHIRPIYEAGATT